MLPLIVDTGHTHLLNPDWDAHSRVHEVWRLSTNILIAGIGLYLLWVSNYLLLPALLSSCIVLGFFSSFTQHSIRNDSLFFSSSVETIYGPMGPNVSNDFPKLN